MVTPVTARENVNATPISAEEDERAPPGAVNRH
jgi:hypothetical protein